jgi:hypothetical protein
VTSASKFCGFLQDLNVIGHSGVVRQVTPGKLTQVQPFSFEERNKEYQSKRTELIQKVYFFYLLS